MNIFRYIKYKLQGTYAFKQELICSNGYMDEDGVCFGLCADWIKYSITNPDKNYITDKYNQKSSLIISFKEDEDFDNLSIAHTMASKNYYNRINYFQEKANLEFRKTDMQDLYETDPASIIDKSFILLFTNDKKGHACAYKIEQQNDGYNYTYFDPNFGETHSIIFEDKEKAITSLQNLLRFEIVRYHSLSKGQMDFCKNPIFINDTEEFVKYLDESWKAVKPEIESYGIYDNSMNYYEFPENLFTYDYYMS